MPMVRRGSVWRMAACTLGATAAASPWEVALPGSRGTSSRRFSRLSRGGVSTPVPVQFAVRGRAMIPIGHGAAAAAGNTMGGRRPPFAIAPGPGEESVWDYPCRWRLEPEPRTVVVRVGWTSWSRCSVACVRVLETANAPTHLHAASGHLVPAGARSGSRGVALRVEGRGPLLDGRRRRAAADAAVVLPVPVSRSPRSPASSPSTGRARVPGRRRSCPCPAGRLLRRLDHAGDGRTFKGEPGTEGWCRGNRGN